MSKLYAEQVSERPGDIDGINSWQWVTADHGAFDGPKQDWIDSHRDCYLRHVTNWDVVVQAGGNCGMYPSLFSKLFRVVYTFEPDPLNFYTLVQNCQYDNVVKLQVALGSHPGMIEVQRHTMSNVGMHQVVERREGAFIPQIRLDDLGLKSCGLMQLDIEGYEIHALHGAINTISEHRPVISCENGNQQILDFLAPFGYKAVDRTKMDTIYKVI